MEKYYGFCAIVHSEIWGEFIREYRGTVDKLETIQCKFLDFQRDEKNQVVGVIIQNNIDGEKTEVCPFDCIQFTFYDKGFSSALACDIETEYYYKFFVSDEVVEEYSGDVIPEDWIDDISSHAEHLQGTKKEINRYVYQYVQRF